MHVESRIFTYYSHSMIHEGIMISRFREGLEKIMNSENLLFKQRYKIAFKHPGTTRDFYLAERMERVSSVLENKAWLPVNDPAKFPTSANKIGIPSSIDHDIYQHYVIYLSRTNLPTCSIDERIQSLPKKINEITHKYPLTLLNTAAPLYKQCIKFLLDLDVVSTTRNDAVTDLKNLITQFMQGTQTDKTSSHDLTRELFTRYSQVRSSEDKKFLAFFHKSSNLGDLLENFLIDELEMKKDEVPHKFDSTKFATTQNSFQVMPPLLSLIASG